MAGADHEVFVGRTGELQFLSGALADARRGRPRLVLVEGEPGMGKTALIRHFIGLHDDLSVVWASGEESEATLRFGVIDQLRAAPALRRDPPARGFVGPDSFAVGTQLIDLLAAPPEAGALIVVVDDLQWVDEPSSRALLFWLRRLRQDCTLVVCATRLHATDRLGDGWARLRSDTSLTRHQRLDGLASAEVAALAAGQGVALPGPAAERLREHTAGNPLYVAGLVAELSEEALRDATGSLPAPHSYAATVLARTTRLSLDARQLVAAAAVLGTRCRLNLAVGTAAVAATAGLLDELGESQLLDVVVRNSAKHLQFRHPLVRAAVYDDLSPSRKRQLHLAAAATLLGPRALGHRVAAADGPDPGLAADLAATADAELLTGAAKDAAGHLLWAGDLAADADTAADHLLRGVELLLVSGELEAARAHEAAVRAAPPSDQRSYVLAAIAAAGGDIGGARDELTTLATRRLQRTQPRLFAQVTSSLALLDEVVGDLDAAVEHAHATLAIADAGVHSRAIATQALALGLAVSGRTQAALASLPDVSPTSGPGPFEADLLMTRAMIRLWSGHSGAAVSELRTVISWAKNGHPLTSFATAYAFLADAERAEGEYDSAVAHAELSVSLADDLDHGWYLAYAHSLASDLYGRMGERRYARAHAADARRAAEHAPHPLAVAHACVADALTAAADRDWVAVSAALGPVQNGAAAAAATHPAVLARWLVPAIEAALETGDRTGAADLLARLPTGVAPADRCRLSGRLALNARDPDSVRDEPFALARAQLEFARSLLRAGDEERARSRLLTARQTLLRLHARPLVAECDAALAACGDSAPSSFDPFLDGLTSREQVVVRLVRQGLTNREIATELFVTSKTIEYHLGNIFAKLGISKRRELGRAVPVPPTARTGPYRTREFP